MLKSKPKKKPSRRLVLISNRLPVSIRRSNGKWDISPSSGGLVSALGPILRNRGGLWMGWPGTTKVGNLNRVLKTEESKIGYSLSPIGLSSDEKKNFYHGFSNEVIWPLFHGLTALCNFDPQYWKTYLHVNDKFAEKIAQVTKPKDYVWVHDYHLMCAGHFLREKKIKSILSFFLHIPFPPPDIFLKLPWRNQILRSLLEYDFIGFQTSRYKRNFLQSVRAILKDADIEGKKPVSTIKLANRVVRVGHFPIGIDYKAFKTDGSSKSVAREVANLKNGFPGVALVLGVDRLDYTKGIPLKLMAFRNALKRYPLLRKKITLIQVVVPSREDIPSYHELKTEIEQLVGEINGQMSVPGWTPIHYIFRNLKRDELLAYYRAARIAMVTPMEDGMNLVAKEFCAASKTDDSVLILSEFAGSAAQLKGGAILVNPFDVEGMADAIHSAFTMKEDERIFRMRKSQKSVREQDIFWWVDAFLKAGNFDLGKYPMLDDFSQSQVDESWWWDLD